MTRRLSVVALGALLAALLSTGTLHASTAIALSNQAMTDAALVVATGRVSAVRSAWEGRTLVTLATVELGDVLKGDVTGSITVVLPGGIDANRRFPVAMTYAGAPQMMVDEEVFLFLDREEGITSGLIVVGFSQGKFSIVQDAAGQRSVSRNLTGLTLRGPAQNRTAVITREPLDDFKDEIRSYLARP